MGEFIANTYVICDKLLKYFTKKSKNTSEIKNSIIVNKKSPQIKKLV